PSTLHRTIYTLPLHDALPIWQRAKVKDDLQATTPRIVSISLCSQRSNCANSSSRLLIGSIMPRLDPFIHRILARSGATRGIRGSDRKSTRLNSSHVSISYAVF